MPEVLHGLINQAEMSVHETTTVPRDHGVRIDFHGSIEIEQGHLRHPLLGEGGGASDEDLDGLESQFNGGRAIVDTRLDGTQFDSQLAAHRIGKGERRVLCDRLITPH